MLFKNEKFKFIFATSYYGAFALVAVVLFIVGCAVNAALLSLAASFLTVAVPYIFYFSAEKTQSPKVKFILGIVGNSVTYACLIMLTLLACLGSKEMLAYRPVALTAIIATIFSLIMYSLRKEWIEENAGYFLVFLLPFFSLLGGFLFDLYLPLYVTFALIAALYIVYIVLCFNNKEIAGSLIAQLSTAAIMLVTSVVYGAVQAKTLRFDINPLNTLVFLPILMMLFYIPVVVGYVKKENENIIYYTIMASVSAVALVFTQYLLGYMWFVGIMILAVLFLAQTVLNEIFGNAKRSRLKGDRAVKVEAK